MANERLRSAILTRGVQLDAMAKDLEVDIKTIERWIGQSRVPHRRTRVAVATYLNEDETYLWPDGLPTAQRQDVAHAEIMTVYPHRSLVPPELWMSFFERAETEIGVLVHAGGFLAENTRFVRLLQDKGRAGVHVRMLLGDPESPEIKRRGEEEGLGEGVAYKIRNALALYRPAIGADGVEFRLHRSTLHNSIFRSDDELLVNTQVYGISAPLAPVLHLRSVAGAELTATYIRSFDHVWSDAIPFTEVNAHRGTY